MLILIEGSIHHYKKRVKHNLIVLLSTDVDPGDFIYVPPFVPHQEINPGDQPSQWVIVRNAQEPIIVNLVPINALQQSATDATHNL